MARKRGRPRPYNVILRVHDSNTSNLRETIVTPAKSKRVRIIRVKALQQDVSAGRRQFGLYFGTGVDITTDPTKAIDVLDIPDLGEATTRTYLRGEGPRGLRSEVLSGQWQATPPGVSHSILVEYEEDP